jgi:hypothetical protein
MSSVDMSERERDVTAVLLMGFDPEEQALVGDTDDLQAIGRDRHNLRITSRGQLPYYYYCQPHYPRIRLKSCGRL